MSTAPWPLSKAVAYRAIPWNADIPSLVAGIEIARTESGRPEVVTSATGTGSHSTVSSGYGIMNSYSSPDIWNTTAVGIAICDPGNPCQGYGIRNSDSSASIL